MWLGLIFLFVDLLLKSNVRTKNISVKTDNDVNIVWNRESIVDLFRSILIAPISLFLVDGERVSY